MRIPRRFTILSLLLLTLLVSVVLAFHISSEPHRNALRELRANGVTITFRRPEPTFVDKLLGDYRFDKVKKLSHEYSRQVDVSRWVPDLNSPDEFDASEVNFTDDSLAFLQPHARTMKVLSLKQIPPNPEQFFSRFESLVELESMRHFDFNWLPNRKNWKSLSRRRESHPTFGDVSILQN